MKKNVLFFLFFCSMQFTYAQVGWKFDYAVLSAPGWETVVESNLHEPQNIHFDAIGFSLDYAFPLKKINAKVITEASLFHFSQSYQTSPQQSRHQFETIVGGISLISHIYFLNIKNNDNSFSLVKEGSFLKKNLFLRPSIGLKHYETRYASSNLATTSSFFFIDTWNSIFRMDAGMGIGLDLAVSSFLKFSPIIELRYAKHRQNWFKRDDFFVFDVNSGFMQMPTSIPDNLNTNAITTLFGIRMEINFR